MNHSPSGQIPASRALIGFLNHKLAEGLSERTIEVYRDDIEQWIGYLGDKEVSRITRQDVEAYLFFMRTEDVPHRYEGQHQAAFSQNFTEHLHYHILFLHLGVEGIRD